MITKGGGDVKKLFLSVLFCIFSVVLVSCSVPYEFSKDMSDLDQIQIEIVNLESEMGYHAGSSYNEENISVIKIIENEKKEDFLLDFKKIKSYQPNIGSRIDSITGEAIRITYPNGDIELITQYGTATVKNGEVHTQTTTFDSDDFSELLDKYS